MTLAPGEEAEFIEYAITNKGKLQAQRIEKDLTIKNLEAQRIRARANIINRARRLNKLNPVRRIVI